MNYPGKHLTASEQSFSSPLLLCVLFEIDILEPSCDVVKLGNPLKTALTHFPSNVLISNDSARFLLALLVKTLEHVKLRSPASLAHKQKKTLLWLDAGIANGRMTCDDSGRRLCEYWRNIFQARQEGPMHFQHEEILRFVQQAPDDINWALDQAEFDDLFASKKDSAPGPDGIPYGVYRCAGGLGSKFLFRAYQAVLEGSNIPECFAESWTVFIPKTSDTDDLGRIIRSPDALRPLTLCNCDCKLLTSACLSRPPLVHYAMHSPFSEMHLHQAEDNIFESETTALAHVACAPQDSGVLLTDFAAAYPSVNHSWIFSVLEHTGLPDFFCRFLRSIYRDSITHVEFAGAERGQFLMARGVRQGCPASGFLFAMAFDPIFRWLQESIFPRNVDNLEFLQPAQCAYADDLAVASSSFRELMLALAPAFRSIDYIAGLNLNYRKCCWVQYGNEEHDSLRTWISEN